MKEFSAFIDLRRCKNWAHKISSGKYLTLQRPVLLAFPKHRVPGSWSLPWTPFRGWWRSATAAAPDLILVEVDGKCQFVLDSSNITKIEAHCYLFSNIPTYILIYPLQYTEHSNISHMDFLHSSSEKNDVFGDRTSGGAICSSLRPHLLRLYILFCMSHLYGQVFFIQHWVIPEPSPFWLTCSKPNAELRKTGKAAKWGDWDASHPPSQTRSWRTGDNKWRSRVVWGVGNLGRGEWKKKKGAGKRYSVQA